MIRQGFGGVQGSAEPGDRFGAALSFGRRISGQPWLAIGAPGESIGMARGAGAVHILNTPSFGNGDKVVWQGAGAPGRARADDHFGAALTATGYGHLAIGVPGQSVAGNAAAGEVDLLDGGPSGLPGAAGFRAITQAPFGQPERNDGFGTVLTTVMAGTIAVGVPGEDIGLARDAGVVVVLTVSGTGSSQLLMQGAGGIAGRPNAGDRFGAALGLYQSWSLVVGAPGEDVGTSRDAGVVHLIEGDGGCICYTGENDRVVHQNSPGVPDRAEAGDEFGATIAKQVPTQFHAPLIGIPFEDIGVVENAGAMQFVNSGGTDGTSFLSQATPGFDGVSERGDRFGSAGANG
jgi:hypothetical protein